MRRNFTPSTVIRAEFQSTHPVWDATSHNQNAWRSPDISIHASRMGCDHAIILLRKSRHISIHASRMGCDNRLNRVASYPRYFNPRIPYGMRLFQCARFRQPPVISIHASRMGCDHSPRKHDRRSTYFNPRIPYGMRLAGCGLRSTPTYFNPRIPYGMRHEHATGIVAWFISIHASRMGCDMCFRVGLHHPADFNPRIPYGMRPAPHASASILLSFVK